MRQGLPRLATMIRVAVALVGLSGCATNPGHASGVDLDQNWSADDRFRWYGATQGSRLIPKAWLLALEQDGDTTKFLDPANVARYRYLPRDPAEQNPLPVGFVLDRQDDTNLSFTKLRWRADQQPDEPWVGLNCSACHTAELTYKGTRIRVDGAPTLADMQSFFEALNRALVETHDNASKFGRFAKDVLGPANDDANQALLKNALASHVAFQKDIETMNASPVRYGYARLDAIGFIFNKVSRVANGNASSANPSTAPVSYPFIWNVPQHDRVQWNGIAENQVVRPEGIQPFDLGALGRNTGEVIGVFADIKPVKDPGLLNGFVSSIDVTNLSAIEQQLGRLRPPLWPAAVLGATDPQAVANGKQLFNDRCRSCHAELARTDLETPIKAVMTPLKEAGTDPWMACNAYTYDATSGVLAGMKNKFFSGDPIGDTAFLSDLLTIEIAGALFDRKLQIVKIASASFFGLNRKPKVTTEAAAIRATPSQRLAKCMHDDSPLLAYKGRPLTGIWATAPYLHNGSVPTLYDVLLPPDRRPKSFAVGSREFDPINVGYVITPSAENSFVFQTLDDAGKPIVGNSNAGHDYGNASLSDEQRRALVEYMKTL